MVLALKMVLQVIHTILEAVRRTIIKWWRPLACLAIALTVAVNGVYIPLITRASVDLMGLSALVTAVVAAFAVREWGKIKGSAE
jgi:CHASE2 domain-containing sensor protein